MTLRRKAPGRFGDFELQKRIGRDGLFHLFRAKQVRLGRPVILKVLPGRAITLERAALLRREAEAANRLDHAGAVRVYEVGDVAGVPYVALAPVAGELLSERLKANPLPPRLAVSLTRQLAETLLHAHERDVIHGALRPEVIWITNDGQARLTGFGCTIQFESIDADMIAEYAGYLAPEQAGARGAVGPATDTYGLGALLYAMVTGGPPHQGANVAETCRLVRAQTPVGPSRLHPGLSEALDRVCLKCLHVSPTRRYGTERPLQRLISDLRRLRGGRSETDTWHQVRGWFRRRSRLVRCAALVFVFGVLPAGWDWQRNRSAWNTVMRADASNEEYVRAARCFERRYADQPHDPETLAGLAVAHVRVGRLRSAVSDDLPAWESVANQWTAIRKLAEILALGKSNTDRVRRELEIARAAGYTPRTEAERRLFEECEQAAR